MSTLKQEIEHLKSVSRNFGKELVCSEFEVNEYAYALANKDAKKIAVLIGSETSPELNAYSVDLENWLDAERRGINSEEIISGLTVLRAFGVSQGQRYISKGDIFQEIPVEDLAVHLEIVS